MDSSVAIESVSNSSLEFAPECCNWKPTKTVLTRFVLRTQTLHVFVPLMLHACVHVVDVFRIEWK
jgi:hypothetical protein